MTREVEYRVEKPLGMSGRFFTRLKTTAPKTRPPSLLHQYFPSGSCNVQPLVNSFPTPS